MNLHPGGSIFIYLFVFLTTSFCIDVQSQTIITGSVRDSLFQTGVPGAIITESFTETQTITNASGVFQLKVPTNTTTTLTIVHKGFQTRSLPVFASGRIVEIGEIKLQSTDLNILEIYKLSNRVSQSDPITRSDLDLTDLSALQGMMQLPYSLQNVAGVYASSMGNQFGNSRLNIRGFDQRNIAVMVNGITLNDPDGSNFNWSGRDGFREMLSSVQIQKGTNRNPYYAPFGGGSLNLLTMPASQRAGGNVGFEYGAGNYMHSSVTLHSGLLNEKFAITLSGVRKTTNGIIDGTWADAWTYYLSMAYAISAKHRIEIVAMGAPQQHGQALNMQHIAAYSHQLATDLGVPEEILDAIPQSAAGRYYNQGFNAIDPDYTGQQYWNGQLHDRHAADFMNENELYSHAPLAQINWYADWSPKISQQTMFYYAGLMAGNTGVSGDVNLDYTGPSAFVDYNSTIVENQYKTASEGILSNAVRNQMTVGGMSQLKYQFNDRFNSALGFNLKSSNSTQYQEVRDLLGGSYFLFTGNQFDDQNAHEKLPGDIIGYHYSDQVQRIDFFGNVEYSGKKLGGFLNGAYSLATNTYTNHLRKDPDQPGQEYTVSPEVKPGYQIKSGLRYSVIDQILLYANYSYIAREPDGRTIMDLPEQSDAASPTNSIFKGFDAGARFLIAPTARIQINYYNYLMVNNTRTQSVTDQLSNVTMLHIFNIDQSHSGIEFEAGFQPVRYVGIEANAAYGKWMYTDDARGTRTDLASPDTEIDYTFKNNHLASGAAPQLQLGTILSVYPIRNSYLKASFRYFSNHFAAWNPAADLTNATEQLWEIPDYYIIDLHAGVTITTNSRYRIALRGHVFNLLDAIYVQDAINNGGLEDLPGDQQEYINSAAAATVFVGLPRTYSAGIQFSF